MAVFLQELCNKLQAALGAGQYPSCINEELERLSVALTSLEDAKEKRNKKSCKDIQSWLCDFQQAAYDAYDFVSCLPLRAPQVMNDVQEPLLDHDRSCCLLINNCAPRQSTQQHIEIELLLIIKDIRIRVEKLVKKQPPCDEIHLHLQQSDVMNNKVQSLGIPPDEQGGVVGMDEDREKMIQLLTSEESDLSLIAIVGKAGVGKTTLAKLVYDDERVSSYFNLKLWVTSSEIYDTEGLSKSISSQLNTPTFHLKLQQSDYTEEVWKAELAENRFILILDDFRNGVLAWEKLREQLKVGLKGSKIVITTEDEEASKTVGLGLPNCAHHLQGLSHGDSWSLLSKYACLENNEEGFKQVGMKIVEKLKGLPLSARMVGSLLRSNIDLNDWNIILNADDVWKSGPNELYGIPAALWLSYQHLPPHIKRCFAYCSVFPRDQIFDKDDLIHMWIAQGLIQPQEGTRMEDSGSDYFDYLVCRSFFLSFQVKRKYIMHNMVRRLAVAITRDESLRLSGVDSSYEEGIERSNYRSKRQQKKVRHLYLQSDRLALSRVMGLSMLGDIETLVLYRTNGPNFNYYEALFKKLKSIRVMYLCDMELKMLPESIAQLNQLRCLDISNTTIGTVSEQVCDLYNLQTLKLSSSNFVTRDLPTGMSKLINLRHLKPRTKEKICNIGRLTLLHEVGQFTVSREVNRIGRHKIEEIKHMNQITVSLEIFNLSNVHTAEEAKEAALNDKEHLRRLSLSWHRLYPSEQDDTRNEDIVLEALKPHPNLEELSIVSNHGRKTPSWLEDDSLVNLEDLYFRQWEKPVLLLGSLQSLKRLIVDDSFKLQRLISSRVWDGGEDAQLFPRLQILRILQCHSLVELIPFSPTLEELKLEQVGLQVLPGFQDSKSSTSSFSLTSLNISDCPGLTTLKAGLLEHQNHHRLQALTRLTIEDCPLLVYLPDHGVSGLVSLKYLYIKACRRVRCNPSDNGSANLPSSLVELKIIECPHLTNDSFFTGIERLHSLTSLVIINGGCPPYEQLQLPTLTSFPGESLQHLKELEDVEINNCEDLELLGFQSLESLKNLKLVACPKLAAGLPPIDASSPLPLDYLEINKSSPLMLTGELIHRLTFLRVLKLMSCDQLACFPKSIDDGLHCLVSLRELHIYACTDLKSLPDNLVSIPSLKELHITSCRKLKYMPGKGVPPSLELLVITGCRQLGKRCLIDHEDWPKISHVFYVQVDGENVRDYVERTESLHHHHYPAFLSPRGKMAF